MQTMMDKMFEFFINELFSFMTSLGVEKINELEKQYNNQKMLLLTTSQFAESDFFKNEYQNVKYIENKGEILSISPELISPVLGLDEIVDNISPVLEVLFICSDRVEQKRLFNNVVSQYLAKSKLTVTLLELSKQQRQDTEYISNKIDALKSEITIVSESVKKQDALKRRVIDSGLGSKINSFIYQAANFYILIVTKKSPTYNLGTEKEIIFHYMNTIQHLIDMDLPEIDEKFYVKPIETFTIDTKEAFETHSIKLDVYKTLFLYRKKLLEIEDDLLKYKNLIPEDFFIAMMELINFIDNDPTFTLHASGISELIKNSKPANGFDRVRAIKDEYKQLGNLILALRPYIV